MNISLLRAISCLSNKRRSWFVMEFSPEYSCSSCAYKSIRSDNYIRHLKTHEKIRVQCQCGAILAPTSIERHRRSERHSQCMKRQKTNETKNVNESGVITVEVKTTIKLKTLTNGQIIIEQDPIKIGNIDYCVVPTHLFTPIEQNEEWNSHAAQIIL